LEFPAAGLGFPASGKEVLVIGILKLGFIWDLGFGIWDFPLRAVLGIWNFRLRARQSIAWIPQGLF
jgi:hypothetical protein